MDLYAENILDHYKHPHHTGTLAAPTTTHEEKNISCGDRVEVQLQVTDGVIDALAWTGEGCAISQAAMSMLSDEVVGKTAEEIMSLHPQNVKDLLGVPVGTRRIKCALLSLHTLKNAIHLLKAEELQPWSETVGNEQDAG